MGSTASGRLTTETDSDKGPVLSASAEGSTSIRKDKGGNFIQPDFDDNMHVPTESSSGPRVRRKAGKP